MTRITSQIRCCRDVGRDRAARCAPQSDSHPRRKLAPTGTLRAVFLGGNPVQGRVDREDR